MMSSQFTMLSYKDTREGEAVISTVWQVVSTILGEVSKHIEGWMFANKHEGESVILIDTTVTRQVSAKVTSQS